MRFELFIATRYLRAKRRQAVVGVITLISVIGVAAGVASLIIALAITNGMRRDMQEKLVGSTAHVMLMRVSADGIRDWRPLLARLRGLPHVTAAAPGLYGQVLISRGARSGGALVEGIVPADQRTVSDLLELVKQGSAEALEPVGRVSDSPEERYDFMADVPTATGGVAAGVVSPAEHVIAVRVYDRFENVVAAKAVVR